MDRRRTSLILLACSLLIGVVVFLRTRIPAQPAATAPPSTPSPQAPSAPQQVRPRLQELDKTLQSADREHTVASARRIRDSLLAFPDGIADLVRILKDPATPLAIRQAAATLLGTVPEGKKALVEALLSGAVAGLERTVILALGIKVVEDGEIFERDGQPYAMELAPGLVVFVQGAIENPEAILQFLAAATPEVRLAAARVLRDSTAHPDVRQGLLGRLGDRDGEVVGEAGAALAAWTQRVRIDDAERGQIVGTILGVIPASEEIVRFRLTGPLSGTPLAGAESARLRALAADAADGTRLFAAEVLGKRIGLSKDEDQLAVPVLARSALTDASADVREAAALALGRVAADPQAVQSLSSALRGDADWEVRAAAARSLAQSAGSADARAALQAAAQGDAHETVRRVAQRSLATLSPK